MAQRKTSRKRSGRAKATAGKAARRRSTGTTGKAARAGKKGRARKAVPRSKATRARRSGGRGRTAEAITTATRRGLGPRSGRGAVRWADAMGRSATAGRRAGARRRAAEAVRAAPADDGARYLELTGATLAGLDDAIALLRARDVFATGDERRLITVELAELEAQRAKVRAEMVAFIANEVTVRPPSEEEVATAKELAAELEAMAAAATAAREIVGLATELLETWRTTQA